MLFTILFCLFSIPQALAHVPGDQPGHLLMRDGITVSSVWNIPDEAPRAAFVILQGSGNVGADGDVSSPIVGRGYQGQEAKLSEQLAEALRRTGAATLRYAKRGFDDPAQLQNQTMPFLIRDAEDALRAAKVRFPGLPAGFVALSEGAVVALNAAAPAHADALFLLSLPTRTFDEGLAYHMMQWPIDILKRHSTLMPDGGLVPPAGFKAPLLQADWTTLDSDRSSTLSLEREVIPAYHHYLTGVKTLLSAPPYADWYASARQLPLFREVARTVTVPVYLYQALDDALYHWSWIVADQVYFSANHQHTTLHLFEGLGHCFAPMDGAFGEIDTSGPLDQRVRNALADDVSRYLVKGAATPPVPARL